MGSWLQFAIVSAVPSQTITRTSTSVSLRGEGHGRWRTQALLQTAFVGKHVELSLSIGVVGMVGPFSIARYTREGATMLASEAFRKGTFFIRMCFESESPEDFLYPASSNDLYTASDEYRAQLLTFGEGAVAQRALQLEALAP